VQAKKILLAFAVLAIFYGCKKQSQPAIKTSSLPEISVTGFATTGNAPIRGDKIYNLLGYGYDITGKYADTSAVRSQAINIAAFGTDNPDRVVFDESKTSASQIINAKDAEDFSQQLSARLDESNGFKFFKGSVTAPFPGQNALSAKYVYGNYAMIIQQKRIKTNASNGLLMNYLTPAFTHDILALSAADLVKKYGTHVLADIVLGAKLNIMYQAETTAPTRAASEFAGFNFAIKKVFGLFTGSLDPINTTDLQTISSPQIVYEAAGADLSKIKVNTTSRTPTVDVADWHLSSTEAGAAFIDISKSGLIPLYALIADPARKATVQSYITKYLMDQQVKLAN
jgi:hypothetical protein